VESGGPLVRKVRLCDVALERKYWLGCVMWPLGGKFVVWLT
jgi:hypothetical protein